MSGIINEFNFISKLSDEFKQNICLFYIFENASLNSNTKVITWKGYNAFIKTSDDKVFGYGENSFGQLGLGHTNRVINPKQILELCDYDIVEISNGLTHCVARNIYGQLFEWGKNDIDITKDKFYKPEIVSALTVENVISICCGYSHTIALTKSGNVYAWGSNKWGQLGINDKKSFSTPVKVQGFNEDHVKSIACGSWHSMALTEKGNVYGWGLNRYGQLGNGNKKDSRSILQIIILNSNSKPVLFKKISCGKDHSLLLTDDGDVYVCGYNHTSGNIFKNETIIKLESKFIDIGAHHFYDISSALKYDGYYEIWGKWNEKDIFPKETKFETLVDIFKYYFVITYRAINPKNFDSIPKRINGKYKEEFIEQSLISSAGGFGEVFNAMNKIDSQIYAIKKIALDENQFDMIFRELNIMHSLNSDYVVKYYNSWMENNYYNIRDSTISYNQKLSNPLKPFLLHIQMEFCIMTLRQFIDDLKDLLQRLPNEATAYKYIYYTSVLLFIEVVESVNYLHKLKPPIIHRDLKPDNILITCGKIGRPGTVVMVKYHEKDHRFIRIADFGLSVRHEFVGQSHTADQGTVKYAAPEVIYGRDYDTKADIYSLGVIIENLFDYENEMTTGFEAEYLRIHQLKSRMIEEDRVLRPDCDEILKELQHCTISLLDLQLNFDFNILINYQLDILEICKYFIYYFIQTKTYLLEKKIIEDEKESEEEERKIQELLSATYDDKAPSNLSVFVRLMNGTLIRLDLDPNKTVESFKSKINERIGEHPENQRLIFGGKQLRDGTTLAEYDIDNESTIFMVPRLNGGLFNR